MNYTEKENMREKEKNVFHLFFIICICNRNLVLLIILFFLISPQFISVLKCVINYIIIFHFLEINTRTLVKFLIYLLYNLSLTHKVFLLFKINFVYVCVSVCGCVCVCLKYSL